MEFQDFTTKKEVLPIVHSERLNTTSSTNLTSSNGLDGLETEKSYDPFEVRKVQHPNSDIGAMVHLLKSSLGMGILAMPHAFKNGGLAFGMVGTLLVGFLCTHCVNMLVYSSHILCQRNKIPSLDFAGTAQLAFQSGPQKFRAWASLAKMFVNGAIMVTYYSGCVVYVVFISASIKQVVDHYVASYFTLDVRIYSVMLLLPLVGLTIIRNLRTLVPFSAIANLCIFISFGITMYYVFHDLPPIQDRLLMASHNQLPIFFSTIVFAMEGIGAVMPVENSMKHPAHFLGCPGVLNISMFIIVTLYAVIGFFGYFKYGNETQGSITLNLPVEEILAQVVKVFIALGILCSYGLNIFVPNEILWQMIEHHFREDWRNRAQHFFRITVAVVMVSVAIALPNLGPIISLVGAVCFSTLGLFIPAVVETVTRWEDSLGFCNWRLWKNALIVVLSLGALLSGSYTSILEIVDTYGGHAS
ncbi:proton-coupled amino acid transporter-like protein CG1139 isoform X2 [Anabrus simplex]|uniref:proton-coupled amino acid transporter-like protein CG1139 isoform X2 n=1 Tax=Anabrus simplex TaxID=316456 RepID=UPI0034DD8A11